MDLVVMAAGMGSRFGGLKQIQPIDNDKNFIIDYSAFDAVRAGFDRIIFIIKEENYRDFEDTIGQRLKAIIPVEYVFQKLDIVPKGFEVPKDRVKPWGTAHAIYCCKDVVSDKFAVINADDFYGYESFQIVADFLRNCEDESVFVSAGYMAKNTLSDKGLVKRGILMSNNGVITHLEESEMGWEGDKVISSPLDQNNFKEISPDTLVSMNMFGFTKKLIDEIGVEMEEFFKETNSNPLKCEFLLPTVVNNMIANGSASVVVKKTPSKWYGITYKEDLDEFKQAIEKMIATGEYPQHLYENAK